MSWFNVCTKKRSAAQMVWNEKPQSPQLPTFMMQAIFTRGSGEDEKPEPVDIDVELETLEEDIPQGDDELEREEMEQNPDAGNEAEPDYFELHFGWNSESFLVAAG